MRAAATSAGLHAVGAVIAVHQSAGTDRFLYCAAADEADAALAADAAHPVMYIDLFAATADDNHHG